MSLFPSFTTATKHIPKPNDVISKILTSNRDSNFSPTHEIQYLEFVYLVTDFPASDVLADGLDGARAFETEEFAGAFGRRVKAFPLESVGPVERCRRDSDQNVVVSHLRVVHFQQLQDLGTAEAGDYYGLHCGGSRRPEDENR